MIRRTADDLRNAQVAGSSRMLTFGTDLIRNGLTPAIGEFIDRGWLTHLATTFTSVVDDWQAARGGVSQDDCHLINLAILEGNCEGLGLGESVARAIRDGRITVPERSLLIEELSDTDELWKVSASAELLAALDNGVAKSGTVETAMPCRENSLLYKALSADIPFTVHPMFGMDDPFTHPACSFAAIGQCAERDFLSFTESVNHLDQGLYLSVGSSVTSPMIFEKALSMSQNVHINEKGAPMTDHKIVVVDLAPSRWDWMHDGEPPETRPEYYLRYCKSFSRAKARSMFYICMDNREFFSNLRKELVTPGK